MLMSMANRAPILFIKGRTYPVVVHHATDDVGDDKVQAALRQCLKIHLDLPLGDILVFMPGKFQRSESRVVSIASIARG